MKIAAADGRARRRKTRIDGTGIPAFVESKFRVCDLQVAVINDCSSTEAIGRLVLQEFAVGDVQCAAVMDRAAVAISMSFGESDVLECERDTGLHDKQAHRVVAAERDFVAAIDRCVCGNIHKQPLCQHDCGRPTGKRNGAAASVLRRCELGAKLGAAASIPAVAHHLISRAGNPNEKEKHEAEGKAPSGEWTATTL